jgi:hypothetical protein
MLADEPLTTHDLVAERGRRDDTGGARAAGDQQSLLSPERLTQLRQRWEDVQTGFVDEPRRTVEEADGLVAELMGEITGTFARERESLEHQWDRGEGVDTEDLRRALQRYRAFFNRLLEA